MQTDTTHGWALRAAKRYAIAAVGCALFALIYAQFSHGVYSPFMTFMFAIPLVCGCIISLILHRTGAPSVLRARRLWALGVATFTVASCLRGVFEIAGTGSAWLYVYVTGGAVLAIAAVVVFLKSNRLRGSSGE